MNELLTVGTTLNLFGKIKIKNFFFNVSENLCFVGSRCINHYYDISCNCFGTHYEGEQCDIYSK